MVFFTTIINLLFVFTIIFNRVAGLSTNGIPPTLFYMSGIIAWNYFAGCITETSSTFTSNASLFGKVYFPRILVPLSKVISGLIRFGVQLIMFMGFYMYFIIIGDTQIYPSIHILLLIPIMIVEMAMFGQGLGMIISSLTIKYRDLSYLINFGTQLLMYASPIVFPLSIVPDRYKNIILLNPMTSIIEGFRQAFFSKGSLDVNMMSYSLLVSIATFFFGILVFNKVEKNFIDMV